MEFKPLREIQAFQLSPQQKHLWQLHQTEHLPYFVHCALLMEGNLDMNTLQAAIEQVVNQHEILHTTYRHLPGMTIPLQVIVEPRVSWNQNYDLSIYTPQEQEAQVKTLFNQLIRQKFNLTQGPVLNLSLVTLSLSKYVLFITLPALCADTVTLKNLVKEISEYYAGGSGKKGLSEKPLQYADLAAWQNELLAGEDTEAGRNFWHQQNFSALTALQLPWEKQPVKQREFYPQTDTFQIDSHVSAKIIQLAQQHNSSVAKVFLTCWNVLLWRLTGQENLVIGVAADGRQYQELKSALGLLTKYLPLDCQLQNDKILINLLRNISKNLDNIYHKQEYFTWEQLVGLPSNIQQFFPLCFEFEGQQEKYAAAGVLFSIYQHYSYTDRFKIKLVCFHQDDFINFKLAYDANFIEAEDIKGLAGKLQTLLESAIIHLDVPISQLPILSRIEQQQLLVKFNNTEVQYSKDKCIHQLFEEQAARTPEKIAIVFADQKITYGQLNSRANKIARYLQQLGVEAEVLVGLYVERSIDTVIGILSILKAGGVYVPLDPAYPKERLAFMLQNSQPRVLLTQKHLVDLLLNSTGRELEIVPSAEQPDSIQNLRVVCLDTHRHSIAQLSEENLNPTIIADNLAYVIYTSGSTGTPKGVRVTHTNLCHYVQAMQSALGITAEDVYLHTASIAFSSSVRQLMVPLTQSATVIIATLEQRKDPRALFEAVKYNDVTVIDIVPSYWRNLIYMVAGLEPGMRQALLNNKLRLILSASEPLLSDIPKQWTFGFQHNARFINMFGQTETCGIVATYPIPTVQDERVKVVPLGRPIPNTQIYLLDQHLQPVPVGVPGELYIGGWGLGQGYFNNPDLTALKFIPHPFSEEQGARLYQTGDLGRYLPDGTIEFLGRSDFQVKIRGFRIELTEIEAVLCQHPVVREAVVVAREDELGKQYLVGYVVPNTETFIQNLKSSDLRNFLRKKLPDYMVPYSFVILNALPLLPNGKVNRQTLLASDQVQQEIKNSIAVPRTPVEEVVAGIWAQILNLKQVGFDNNFFELGGHSLLATQVISKVREAFQVELPLRSLFESPTVAGFAERIEMVLRSGQQLEIPPIERFTRDEKVLLSFAQQRLWFLDQLQPGSSFYNLSRSVLLQGSLNVAALLQSLNEIVRRHEVLRTTITSVDEQPMQVIAPTLSVKMPVVDLQGLPKNTREVETQRLAKQQARRCFNLTKGPLLCTTLLQLGSQEYMLLFTIHHIVADGWSAGIILREITALYESFCAGIPSPLPQLPIQYADFAIWQRQWLQKKVLASQMDYWKQQLGSNLPVLELPTDRPRPPVQTFVGKKQFFELSPTLTEALKTLSQQEGATLFMTLLATFKTLLYRYTGQEDILVGSPIANRNHNEIEGLIGFFVNTLVLRTNLSGNPRFRELLKRVQEVTLDAYTHQDLPFEQLVEELQPNRNLSHTPLFQVMFVLQNAPMEVLTLPGLSLSLMKVESETTRFDLTLSLTETEQGLMGVLEYNTDLFNVSTITRMVGHFQTLLKAIVTNPEQRIWELPLLTANEQHQLLVEWNSTEADYPKDACIHQLFEAQSWKTPDAVAVVSENQQLTYRELNEQANQLAHYLQRLGVGPEIPVGICVKRSIEMVVGLLGILKAGGAYVPLDITHPSERLVFILEDAQIPVLLTQQALAGRFFKQGATVVCLDTDWKSISHESVENPINKAIAQNLAYIIYTSGSTGKPKGTLISHQGLVNYLAWCIKAYSVEQGKGTLVHSSIAFDLTITSLFSPLLVGRQVELLTEDSSVEALSAALLKITNLSLIKLTPAHLELLNQQLRSQEASDRSRFIIIGGENLLAHNIAFWQNCAKNTLIVNEYGPTETVVGCCIYTVPKGKHHSGSIPIGRPIANIKLYVLDQHLQPVPIGIPGELYISGVGLARGYLNCPELTSEKFIPNPFSTEPGARFYKTADLVRYLPNGEIEYLGRIDRQIKLHGFRIEPGEIEGVLTQHPQVQQAVVVAQEDEFGNKYLVAYVIPQEESALLIDELRILLTEKLPAYMMPLAFVKLNTLPLTVNGKVDRCALPRPNIAKLNLKENYVAPQNPIEQALADIWMDLLCIERVGIYDNFFELGGNSLRATQFISRVRSTFRTELTLHKFFEDPTIASLSHKLVKSETNPGQVEKIAQVLEKIKSMPSETKRQILEQNRKAKTKAQ
ncbi:amino acid adenylation domain-containing protein [Scytonema sp. NUACC26]|uniref:amino acid adenylation domain-containing protein n=1 Tax=Scytonema sp. NUACC26 TaxID=3140176 RepID=UPI0034DC44AD